MFIIFLVPLECEISCTKRYLHNLFLVAPDKRVIKVAKLSLVVSESTVYVCNNNLVDVIDDLSMLHAYGSTHAQNYAGIIGASLIMLMNVL